MYQRLQKLQLCMSHWNTIRILDKLGECFDSEVLKWKKKSEDMMRSDGSLQVLFRQHALVLQS